ncbi:baseplate J/gp47 family protein [Geomonas nitrogeniifigens]|uniref:baseplate J/gp47 family protein n=1 Tax=Geomonas diazotrophica TaxID=2843197 RepID=UPI001C2BEEB8|nr:baseplate J/gp47 family protein [Geomonas nitrogeniifigens]QXE88233.1 baseplate J/gp47 family protein [Geomonas nitrogeniifigens]
MPQSDECKQNRDALKPVREGTSQDQRLALPLDPGFAPVDQRDVAHGMVFAKAYASFLNYFNADNAIDGTWAPFFGSDISVQLALAAVQDVEFYRQRIKEYLDFLKDLGFGSDETKAKNYLGYLFSSAGSLARELDRLKDALPADVALKGMLRNLVVSQLAPALNRLISYYKADLALTPDTERLIADLQPGLELFGTSTVPFSAIFQAGLGKDWITDGSPDWTGYTGAIVADASVYGTGIEPFQRINHIATHNLFTSILDQFLKAYVKVASEGERSLEQTLTGRDDHQPHYALFLAFLRLFAYARDAANTLTARHLDFYYREILRLEEKPAQPGHAHLLAELAKQVETRLFPTGELFKAGKDALGKDAFYAADQDFAANQAKVADLKTLYRHGTEKVGVIVPSDKDQGRLFASPVANSADGKGAELTSVDKSWHPFHNKRYQDGMLAAIDMPRAAVGFAIASHYLFLAQGERGVTVTFQQPVPVSGDFRNDVTCYLTTAKGWLAKDPVSFSQVTGGLRLELALSGADPALVPYSADIHGYNFDTDLPVLMVQLKQQDDRSFVYPALEDVTITGFELDVDVANLKAAALANDFGPVDASKPFQPFGPSPVANQTFVIGSKEMFQKKLTSASLLVTWQATPAPYGGKTVNAVTEYLQGGSWHPYRTALQTSVTGTSFTLLGDPQSADAPPYLDAPDSTENEPFSTDSRYGFVRLRLSEDFGQASYEQALIDYIKRVTDADPNNDGTKPAPPVGPVVTGLSLDYSAGQAVTLNSADQGQFLRRLARFFNVAPFGTAEQHGYLKSALPSVDSAIYLLPQMKHANRDDLKIPQGQPVKHEAEFYIGVTDLKPPQNLALLFQVVDGSADPLSIKPQPHLNWSYLRQNEWIPFGKNQVSDGTGELLDSGIITFSVPREASADNGVLPPGMHWLRASVAGNADSVCRLIMVAAQALRATFTDHGNDPAFSATPLPAGTISKLDQPDADVKGISQPFAGFGGRGKESPRDFYTRISERLRHKDRAIALWDYERLVLEAFPQVYRVKCLNHTQYEPDQSGTGIYRELAPGHVTVVTIPNQRFLNLRDPLRPYTSLGLLEQIAQFLKRRTSCFVKLHVKNPQFEEVRVACKVRLLPGLDQSFFERQISDALVRFLSPWASPGGGSPSFGGKVRSSVLINFLEDLPYVDCVTDFKLFHSYQDDDNNQRTKEVNEASGSKAISVLVSARKHQVSFIDPALDSTPGELCRCAP